MADVTKKNYLALAERFSAWVECNILSGRFAVARIEAAMTDNEREKLGQHGAWGAGQDHRVRPSSDDTLMRAGIYTSVLEKAGYGDYAAQGFSMAEAANGDTAAVFRFDTLRLMFERKAPAREQALAQAPAVRTPTAADDLGLLESRPNRGGFRAGHAND